MILVLDAYNVIHGIPFLADALDQSLQSAREALIAWCEDVALAKAGVQKVQIIFDGKTLLGEDCRKVHDRLEVIYTNQNEKADDRILSFIEDPVNHPKAVVVSDDNFVRNSAKAYGVNVMSVAVFYKWTTETKSPKIDPGDRDRKRMDRQSEEDITDEYKKFLGLH